MSPTARSLKLLRDQGMAAEVVEKTIPKTFIKKDLFGCIDIVAIGENGTIGVQTTTSDHLAVRVTKMRESEHFQTMLDAGWRLVAHGWKRGKNGRWTVREVDCS